MRTIILCGGRGTRMYEKTERIPKPLVEIGGKPILYHIFDMYMKYGFNKFDLALGYKGDLIVDYLKKNPIDADIKAVDTGLDTTTGGRVLKINPQEPFMLTYGDGVSNIAIDELVDFHNRFNDTYELTISGARARSRYGRIDSMNHHVSTMVEKPWLESYVNCGFWVCEPDPLFGLSKNESTEQWCKRLAEDFSTVNVYFHEGFWFGCDTYKDYLRLNELWEKHKTWDIQI